MKIAELLVQITYIWVILSALYHPVVSMLQCSAKELLQLRLRQLYVFIQALFTSHVGNTLTMDSSGRTTSMIHAQYGHSGHPSLVQHGGLHGLLTHFCREPGKRQQLKDRVMMIISGEAADSSHVLSNLAKSAGYHAKNYLFFGLFSICSLSNKGPLLHYVLSDRKLDFLCLTDTWQKHDYFHLLTSLFLRDIPSFCKSCTTGRGGDLVILYKEKWKVSRLTVSSVFF